MKVKKVVSRFAAAPDDGQELQRVARALGSELPRHRLDVLREFRAQLARVSLNENSYAAGYVNGMLDVAAEYEIFVQKAAEEQDLARTALRDEWRAVLMELAGGPKLPSELATRLGKDRPSITRILKRLRTAGLVQAYASDSLDGRRRPHRLTLKGQRLLDSLAGSDSPVSAEVARGIALAVRFFRHLVSHPQSSLAELDEIAGHVFDDAAEASRAVHTWVEESQRARLISELDPAATPDGQSRVEPSSPELHDALRTRIPSILDQIETRKDEQVPIYVRTNEVSWGAWAHALQNHATGMSRTIIQGDITSGTVQPPDRRFNLVYDDPDAIATDRDEPTMQALWARADQKFVVTSTEEEVPDGFIQLELAPEKD